MKLGIRKQLLSIYILAVLIPIVGLGSFLIAHTNSVLTSYHQDLLDADNLRVRTIFDEITTQVSQISEEIVNDKDIVNLLSYQYYIDSNYKIALSKVNLRSRIEHYPAISSISIYTNNRHFFSEGGFIALNSSPLWFEKAAQREDITWCVYENDKLWLLKQIPLSNRHDKAVLQIQVNSEYLYEKIVNSQYGIQIMLEDESSMFATDNIEEEKTNAKGMASKDELTLYHSNDRAYIYVYSTQAHTNISQIIGLCFLISGIALLVPGLISIMFANYFSKRILMLQAAMHKASMGDTKIVDQIDGKDEISEAFTDLQTMVDTIENNKTKIYEAKLREISLEKEQHAMEFKMLASQINPHFLYNTLESIRMKAFTAGDKDVAEAIKLLGKSMRYVFENVGINYTSLQKEMDHVSTYLGIQKMRFENKFISKIIISEDLDLSTIKVMPLLIQPIVENAILHGLEEKEADGEIIISISKNDTNDIISISVRDNGCGMDKETADRLRRAIEIKDTTRNKSIGLYNINQRLKLSYGDKCQVLIDSVDNGGTTVYIEFPLEYI